MNSHPVFAFFTIGVLCTCSLVQGQVVPDALPHEALSAGPPTQCPLPPVPGGPPPGNFEFPSVPPQGFLYGFQFPGVPGVPGGGPTAWQPWTMNGACGIASNGSGFLSTATTPPNEPAPEGIRVAFLQQAGSMTAPFTFAPGAWRLRFRAAQRSFQGINQQRLRVQVGTTEVFEAQPVGVSYQVYTTRAMWFATTTTTTLLFQGLNTQGDHTAFVDQVEVEPIRDWHTASTWNLGTVPGPGNEVLIPADIEVALRTGAAAATVTVQGELLTTSENADLSARWVAVTGSGAVFEVGRELTPYSGQFTLTLTGNNRTENAMGAGSKFLMSMDGGQIDMHGAPKTSWSKLVDLDDSGSVIQVTDATGWQEGDKIVVAFTGHVSHAATMQGVPPNPYTGPRSQAREIDVISPSGHITLLGAPLVSADHCTAPFATYYDGNSPQTWTLDQRAEVGMLTHNVCIVGEATPLGQLPFGGHVMIMACCPYMPTGRGRFSHVELRNMGQSQVLGRYPMHWHMQRSSGAGQFLRHSSIHQSHNRAVTLHGTHGVTVENNVCFDIFGHAMFLEDGVEKGNRLVHNLVLAVKKGVGCDRMLPHDNSKDEAQNRTPAAFWISHPEIDVIDNVAADSFGVGYWFALHKHPTGLSSTQAWIASFGGPPGWNASTAAPGVISGNVCHSMKMGIDVHDSVNPNVGTGGCVLNPPINEPQPDIYKDPRNDDSLANTMWTPTAPVLLTGFVVYGCTSGIYTGGGMDSIGTITFRNWVLADNGVHAHLASMDTVDQSLLVRDSGNRIFPTGLAGNGMDNSHLHGFEKGHAYVVYDGPGRLRDCHLAGYSQPGGFSAYYSDFGAARRHPDHRVSALTFEGGGLPIVDFRDFAAESPKSVFAHPHVFGIAIVDETLCLTNGVAPFPGNPLPPTLVTNHPMMHLTSGSATSDVLLNPMSPRAWLSPFRWSHLQVRYFVGTGNQIAGTNLYQFYPLLVMDSVPTAVFTRQAFLTSQTWPQEKFESVYLPSAQMRQLPVIVKPAGSSQAECVYELLVRDPTDDQTPDPLHRVDVSIDDFYADDVVRLRITHEALPAWTPTLFINDNPAYINHNGDHPHTLLLQQLQLLPAGSGGPAHPGPTTSWQLLTPGGVATIDLRLVKPVNSSNRAHRISITW